MILVVRFNSRIDGLMMGHFKIPPPPIHKQGFPMMEFVHFKAIIGKAQVGLLFRLTCSFNFLSSSVSFISDICTLSLSLALSLSLSHTDSRSRVTLGFTERIRRNCVRSRSTCFAHVSCFDVYTTPPPMNVASCMVWFWNRFETVLDRFPESCSRFVLKLFWNRLWRISVMRMQGPIFQWWHSLPIQVWPFLSTIVSLLVISGRGIVLVRFSLYDPPLFLA